MANIPDGFKEVTAFGRTFHFRDTFSENRLFRFLTKIDFEIHKDTGCWCWIGAKNEGGYGTVNDGQRVWIAHRLAWVMLVGPIDSDIHLHHLVEELGCIGPNCVNPYHLEPLSPEEHVWRNPDNITMVRANSDFCERGHELTADNVYIRRNGSRQCRKCRALWNARQHKIKYGTERRPDRTHCKCGHALEGDNAYEWNGQVYCRACHNDHTKRKYHEKRANAIACLEGHPYVEYGGIGPNGRRYCKECIRLRDEKIRQSKVVDGVECCKHGHPRIPENTYRQKGTNRPLCRICLRASQNKAYDKRKMKYNTQSN